MRAILIITAFLLVACGPSYQSATKVQERQIITPVPVITETLPAVKHDTIIVATKIVQRDTVIDVRYNTKTQTIYLRVKPDSVKIKVVDTVQTFTGFSESEMKSGKMSGFVWGAGGTGVFLVLILYAIKKFKG